MSVLPASSPGRISAPIGASAPPLTNGPDAPLAQSAPSDLQYDPAVEERLAHFFFLPSTFKVGPWFALTGRLPKQAPQLRPRDLQSQQDAARAYIAACLQAEAAGHMTAEQPLRRYNLGIPVTEGGLGPSGSAAALLRAATAKYAAPGQRIWPCLSPDDQARHNLFWENRKGEAFRRREAGELARKCRRMKLLVNCGVYGVIFVDCGKSAGKSRGSQLLAAAIRVTTRASIDIMPATGNLKNVTLGRMSDLPSEQWMPVKKFTTEVRGVKSYDQMRALIPLTLSDGVGILTEHLGKPEGVNNSHYGLEEFLSNCLRLKPNTTFLVLDGGNDDSDDELSIATWAARLAHVITFVFQAGDAPTTGVFQADASTFMSDDKSGSALNRAVLDGLTDVPELEHSISRTGLAIATPDKVRQSVVVASRGEVPHGTIVGYMQQAGLPGSTWEGRSGSLPLDPYLAGKRADNQPNPCIWDKLDEATRTAAIDVALAVLEQLVVVLGIDVPDTDKNPPPISIDES